MKVFPTKNINYKNYELRIFFNSDWQILLRLTKALNLLFIASCFAFFILLLFYLFDNGATMVAEHPWPLIKEVVPVAGNIPLAIV